MLDRAEAAQVLEIVKVDVPVVDLIAAPAQQIADHVLARTFSAAGRGNRDKIPCGGKLRVETGIDGVEDFAFGIVGTHCRAAPVVSGSNHTQTGLPTFFDCYENRGRVHTMTKASRRPECPAIATSC